MKPTKDTKQENSWYMQALAEDRLYMETIMRVNSNAISAYLFNLSKNLVISSVSTQAELTEVAAAGTVEGMLEASIKSMPTGVDRAMFTATFNPERLKRCAEIGEVRQSCEYYYNLPNNRAVRLRTNVELFRNPSTGDIEGIAYTLDITKEFMNTKIDRILLTREYDCVAVIGLETEQVGLRSIAFGNKKRLDIPFDYKWAMEACSRSLVLPQDRELFLHNVDLSNIKKQLRANNSYSFTMTGLSLKNRRNIRMRRYTYYYLDSAKNDILVTMEDVTGIMNKDVLTGYYNRLGFYNRVHEILTKSQPQDQFAIVFFDIMGFKVINELFGMEGGDLVLRKSTELIEKSGLRPLAIARIEADHFAALVRQEYLDFEAITRLCERSFTRMNGKQFKFFAHCGVYLVEDKTDEVGYMCDRAKLAEQTVVESYLKPYAIFDASMQDSFIREQQLTSDLHNALKNKEFTVYYQPIYDVKTGKIASAEALVRWQHPTRGVLPPSVFIPAFEANGHISELDLFVVNTVNAFTKSRVAAGKHMVPTAVNFSRLDFFDEDMLKTVIGDLKADNIPKDYARLEITESAYATLSGEMTEYFHTFRELGVKLLLDDFGSGYSSFSSLQSFDYDIIKLDMGFIRKLGECKKCEGIITSIITMSHSLGSQVIAEGVETQEQLDFLKAADCDYIQGYYYSKPLAEQDFEALLDKEEGSMK